VGLYDALNDLDSLLAREDDIDYLKLLDDNPQAVADHLRAKAATMDEKAP
jgi:hypothetical protein